MIADFIGPGRKWKEVELQQNALYGGDLIEELNVLLEGYIIRGMDQNDEFIWKATSMGGSLLNLSTN